MLANIMGKKQLYKRQSLRIAKMQFIEKRDSRIMQNKNSYRFLKYLVFRRDVRQGISDIKIKDNRKKETHSHVFLQKI